MGERQVDALMGMIRSSFGQKRQKALYALVDQIQALTPRMRELSDVEIRRKTWEFRRRLAGGQSLDGLLPEAYAVVREASRRVLGMEHFPVQLLGGVVLHQGGIAQMCTGEGKTLAATLPAYLNALPRKGVHIVTVNDYLAKRDREEMGPLFEFLGLSVGVVLGGMDADHRHTAYHCDITYVTNHELGFDFLRDNMVYRKEDMVQRGLHYAVIDEVDSVLIDDARTPLIISGEGEAPTKLYEACDMLAKRMHRGADLRELSTLDKISGVEQEETGDFIVSEKENRVYLTEKGIRRTERFFRVDNIADPHNAGLQNHMQLALRANYLMARDKDYVVKERKVFIVDGSTGRIMPGRRYSDGLHQAIEAKERVRIQRENRTIATITYQNLFNQYDKKSGMTGTGRSAQQEFQEIYGMEVVEIPTNRPILRVDREDVVFRTQQEKLDAVCAHVVRSHEQGRPVLVGTVSVSDSEAFSRLLERYGVAHHVLNAKNHQREAAIVAEAGKKGAVTIATNMAGRGTDIKLDAGAKALGGLLVIGTQRHDSQRVDGQLRGRSGRQGDPGESRFYLSLEDDLLRVYGGAQLQKLVCGGSAGTGASSAAVTKAIALAQQQVESTQYAQRKRMFEYDQVLDVQRKAVYEQRRQILTEADVTALVDQLMEHTLADVGWDPACDSAEGEGIQALLALLDPQDARERGRLQGQALREAVTAGLLERHRRLQGTFLNPGVLQERERVILLQQLDAGWVSHIERMEHLREGITLMRYAQKDPLVEYRRASVDLFEQMNRTIRWEAVMAILHIEHTKGEAL